MPPLVGRDPELATIDRFLRSVGEGYQAVVFRGGAGYGKSALLEETVVRARAAGFRALTARPAETEAELPFGVLAELLEPVGMSELELPAPQARALNVALRRVDPDEARPVDPLGLSLAVVAALRELAKEEPLLVALDDLQWCDPPSLRTLEFALRRVESQQIGLAAGLRSGDGPEVQIPAANGRLTAVEVGPLDAGAFEAVVRRGNRLPRPVLRQLYVACDGNPLFGKEVATLLAEHGLPDDPAALIPVPPSASDAIGRRVAKLGLDTRDVLLGAAALPRPTVDVLLAAYGERRLEDALAEAAAAGIVVVDRERVRFSHPLVAAAVYEAATPARRRAAHAALARALDRAEERAPQLALATTNASAPVAAELEAAAAAAKARGALDAAGRLLEQAATITPVRDRAARRRRGLEAARFHLAAGDTERARSLLDRLLQFSQPGEERAEVCSSWRSPTEATRSGDATTPTLHSSRRSRAPRSRFESTTASGSFTSAPARPSCPPNTGAPRSRSPRRSATRLRSRRQPPAWYSTTSSPAGPPAWTSSSGPSRSNAESADRRLRATVDPRGLANGCGGSVSTTARESSASRCCTTPSSEATSGSGRRCSGCWRTWKPTQGTSCSRGSTRPSPPSSESSRTNGRFGCTACWEAPRCALLGELEEAETLAHAGQELALSPVLDPWLAWGDYSLGLVALERGEPAAALEHFEDSERRYDAAGFIDPVARQPPNGIEALIGLGRLEDAAARIAEYEGRCWIERHVRVLALVARFSGLVASLRGEHEHAEAEFARSLELQEQAPSPYERARTLMALATARRRHRRRGDARRALEEAVVLFERSGAAIWADRARADIAALGLRRGPVGELTPMEDRVARAVAGGATNREAGAALFLSERTIEFHLRNVYRKLDLHSRAELAAVLSRATPTAV